MANWQTGLSYIGGIAGALGAGGPQAMTNFVNKIAENQQLELAQRWEGFQSGMARNNQLWRDKQAREHDFEMQERQQTHEMAIKGQADSQSLSAMVMALNQQGPSGIHALSLMLPPGQRAGFRQAAADGGTEAAAQVFRALMGPGAEPARAQADIHAEVQQATSYLAGATGMAPQQVQDSFSNVPDLQAEVMRVQGVEFALQAKIDELGGKLTAIAEQVDTIDRDPRLAPALREEKLRVLEEERGQVLTAMETARTKTNEDTYLIEESTRSQVPGEWKALQTQSAMPQLDSALRIAKVDHAATAYPDLMTGGQGATWSGFDSDPATGMSGGEFESTVTRLQPHLTNVDDVIRWSVNRPQEDLAEIYTGGDIARWAISPIKRAIDLGQRALLEDGNWDVADMLLETRNGFATGASSAEKAAAQGNLEALETLSKFKSDSIGRQFAVRQVDKGNRIMYTNYFNRAMPEEMRSMARSLGLDVEDSLRASLGIMPGQAETGAAGRGIKGDTTDLVAEVGVFEGAAFYRHHTTKADLWVKALMEGGDPSLDHAERLDQARRHLANPDFAGDTNTPEGRAKMAFQRALYRGLNKYDSATTGRDTDPISNALGGWVPGQGLSVATPAVDIDSRAHELGSYFWAGGVDAQVLDSPAAMQQYQETRAGLAARVTGADAAQRGMVSFEDAHNLLSTDPNYLNFVGGTPLLGGSVEQMNQLAKGKVGKDTEYPGGSVIRGGWFFPGALEGGYTRLGASNYYGQYALTSPPTEQRTGTNIRTVYQRGGGSYEDRTAILEPATPAQQQVAMELQRRAMTVDRMLDVQLDPAGPNYAAASLLQASLNEIRAENPDLLRDQFIGSVIHQESGRLTGPEGARAGTVASPAMGISIERLLPQGRVVTAPPGGSTLPPVPAIADASRSDSYMQPLAVLEQQLEAVEHAETQVNTGILMSQFGGELTMDIMAGEGVRGGSMTPALQASIGAQIATDKQQLEAVISFRRNPGVRDRVLTILADVVLGEDRRSYYAETGDDTLGNRLKAASPRVGIESGGIASVTGATEVEGWPSRVDGQENSLGRLSEMFNILAGTTSLSMAEQKTGTTAGRQAVSKEVRAIFKRFEDDVVILAGHPQLGSMSSATSHEAIAPFLTAELDALGTTNTEEGWEHRKAAILIAAKLFAELRPHMAGQEK